MAILGKKPQPSKKSHAIRKNSKKSTILYGFNGHTTRIYRKAVEFSIFTKNKIQIAEKSELEYNLTFALQ